jgi:hypothetical protein
MFLTKRYFSFCGFTFAKSKLVICVSAAAILPNKHKKLGIKEFLFWLGAKDFNLQSSGYMLKVMSVMSGPMGPVLMTKN